MSPDTGVKMRQDALEGILTGPDLWRNLAQRIPDQPMARIRKRFA